MLEGPLMVDTGYWVGLARSADQHHERALAWQAHIDARRLKLLTTDWVLLETFRVLRSRRVRAPIDAVIECIEAIRADPGVEICHVTPEIREAGWRRVVTQREVGYSWEDTTTIEIMRSRRLQHVLAFDHHFQAAKLSPLMRSEPDAYS